MEVRDAGCPLGAKCEEVKTEADGRQILYRCPWYYHLHGKHPQLGTPVDAWECSIKWLPMLMLENTKEAIETVASLNSFRNEMVRGQQTVLKMASNGEVKEIADARDDHS